MRRSVIGLSAVVFALSAAAASAAPPTQAACASQLRDAQTAFDARDSGEKQTAKAAAALKLGGQLCEQAAFVEADDVMRSARLLLATE